MINAVALPVTHVHSTRAPLCTHARSENRFGSKSPVHVGPVRQRAVRLMRGTSLRRQNIQNLRTTIISGSTRSNVNVSTTAKIPQLDSFHVHFGAGRLGLGLVLPALQESAIPYAILQRPSKEWSSLAWNHKDPQIKVLLNDEEAVPGGMHLYTNNNDKDLPEIGEAECDPESPEECYESHLVLTNDKPAWSKLIKQATSFSCSVGPTVHEWLGPLLKQLPIKDDVSSRPVLYACENDHNAVTKLSEQLEGRVQVVPCMVDRICARRTVDSDNGRIVVETEEFSGSIIMLKAPPVDPHRIPLQGDAVFVPEDAEVAEYFYKRKLLLVNGMHTALGFLTLVDHETSFKRLDRIAEGTELNEVLAEDFVVEELPLLTMQNATDTLKADIDAWAVAQVLALFSQFPVEVMLRAHETESVEQLVEEVFAFAAATVARFDSMSDTTARVLGGGVNDRFETRLTPTCDAVRKQKLMSRVWATDDVCKLFLEKAEMSIDRVAEVTTRLTERATKFAQRDEALRMASKMHCKAALHAEFIGEISDKDTVAVLFDFDGTLADTEYPAMEVAYWELVPYMPGLEKEDLTVANKKDFIFRSAGKAFELMVKELELERQQLGMYAIDTVRKLQSEDEEVLAIANRARQRFGLKTFTELREGGLHESVSLIELQKEDAVEALATLAAPCKHVPDMLDTLQALGVPFSIATTLGKPRVPVCVKACGMEDYFPPDRIHSGESDFDPPQFKPDPAVYLKAAMAEDALPKNCLAVEDSLSGVGSAANAGVGMIVGYVGGTHIATAEEEQQAHVLMSGDKSNTKQGADVVISDMRDLKYLVQFFRRERKEGRERPYNIANRMLQGRLRGKFWVNERQMAEPLAPPPRHRRLLRGELERQRGHSESSGSTSGRRLLRSHSLPPPPQLAIANAVSAVES